jgi:hypothetical protein
MRTNGTDQTSGYGVFRGGTSDRVRTGALLRQFVRDVVKVARVLDPVAFPGVAQEVRGPRSSSYQALLAAARAILQRVTPIKAAFVDRGVPADFDETMTDLIDTLEAATQRKSSGLSEQSGGTAGLNDDARRGVALVRQLDAIMTHLLRNNPSLKASWKTASRIQRDRESSPTPPGGTVNPTPAASH